MKCPTCTNALLVMSERQGVEIDYCPQCRGVWLDRGELDKLLERAAAQSNLQTSNHHTQHRDDRHLTPAGRGNEHRHAKHERYYKQKSWLSEIFD
jgi:uncharacterized protein